LRRRSLAPGKRTDASTADGERGRFLGNTRVQRRADEMYFAPPRLRLRR
jgi:hypothetical protein